MKRILVLAILALTLTSNAYASKILDVTVRDGGLNVVKTTGTTMVFCSAQPANYAGIAAVALVTKSSMTSGSYTGPATSSTNRQLAVNAVTGMTPSANGTVTFVVVTNGTDTILAGTTVTSQAVTTSQTWNSPAWNINIADPT